MKGMDMNKFTDTRSWDVTQIRACRWSGGNTSANHCRHQHLLISEESVAQSGEVGHLLVQTLTVLFPCLPLHVKLFLLSFLDELLSWREVLKKNIEHLQPFQIVTTKQQRLQRIMNPTLKLYFRKLRGTVIEVLTLTREILLAGVSITLSINDCRWRSRRLCRKAS